MNTFPIGGWLTCPTCGYAYHPTMFHDCLGNVQTNPMRMWTSGMLTLPTVPKPDRWVIKIEVQCTQVVGSTAQQFYFVYEVTTFSRGAPEVKWSNRQKCAKRFTEEQARVAAYTHGGRPVRLVRKGSK